MGEALKVLVGPSAEGLSASTVSRIKKHGLKNGMVERLIRTVKEQCIHPHRFESVRHVDHVIVQGMKSPAESFR